MPKKGQINNPKGRAKGSQNKDIKPIRDKFNQLLTEYSIEQMVKDLRGMEAKDRMNCIASLAEFIVPKLARTELTGLNGDEIKVRSFNLTPPKVGS